MIQFSSVCPPLSVCYFFCLFFLSKPSSFYTTSSFPSIQTDLATQVHWHPILGHSSPISRLAFVSHLLFHVALSALFDRFDCLHMQVNTCLSYEIKFVSFVPVAVSFGVLSTVCRISKRAGSDFFPQSKNLFS